MSILSIFKNKTTPAHCEPLPTILHKIRRGYCQDEIRLLRQYLSEGHENAARQILGWLPRFSPGGHFKGGRDRDSLVSYSGLVMLETAYLPADVLSEYRKTVESDRHAHACFLGPEGDNLRIFVKVDGGPDQHEAAYLQVKNFLENAHKLTILSNDRGLLALCPFSYDPDAYFNPDAETFPTSNPTAPAPKSAGKAAPKSAGKAAPKSPVRRPQNNARLIAAF